MYLKKKSTLFEKLVNLLCNFLKDKPQCESNDGEFQQKRILK